jgi:hypothetical protein
MKRFTDHTHVTDKQGFALGLALTVGLIVSPLANAGGIDPDANEVLKSMSDYLGGLAAFSMNAEIDLEVVLKDGQKVQLSASANAVIQRPNKMRIQRHGVVANADIIFDGKTLTLYGKNLNSYYQTGVPGTIDDAIWSYEHETGLPAPGADLLFADPYAVLSSGVESGMHLGMGYVDGIECHHLAFREDDTDWQIWVKTGNVPLPMKYVITSKWQTAAPQYQIRLRDWNLKPQISGDQFTFSPPKGAVTLETLLLDELGGLVTAEEGK